MKTIVEINSTNYGSTGNIMLSIADEARLQNFDVFTFCKNSKESNKHITDTQSLLGFRFERLVSEELSYLTGLRDSFNYFGTKSLLKKLDEIKPDLIHFHTLHDNFVNLELLFGYIKKNRIPIIWTMHDCWALTGQCPMFDMIGCEKWKTECHNCPLIHETPESLVFDTTKIMHSRKKKLFSDIENLTIVTPSKWMESNIKKSYLQSYRTKVINNGINLETFCPQSSDFKTKNNLDSKFIVLGVANKWAKRKGLDDFVKLSKELPDTYQVVLVGTNEDIDRHIPENIISIHRTYNQKELADIYSSADLFVNPTLEEVFGLVNVEALACGTPVATYETGGCSEVIDNTCGTLVEKGNYEQLKNEIIRICESRPYKKEACLTRSKEFDVSQKFKEYVDLYKEIIEPGI